MKIKRYIVDLVDDGSLAFQLAEKELFMNWNADEVEGEECEDCISRKEVEKLKKYRLSYDTNTTVPKTDIFVKIAGIKELPSVTPQQTRWIPVSERLPEDKTYVLTTIKVHNRIAHVRSGWYEDGFFFNDNGDTWKTTDMEVKAWMPLPQPYKTESEEV